MRTPLRTATHINEPRPQAMGCRTPTSFVNTVTENLPLENDQNPKMMVPATEHAFRPLSESWLDDFIGGDGAPTTPELLNVPVSFGLSPSMFSTHDSGCSVGSPDERGCHMLAFGDDSYLHSTASPFIHHGPRGQVPSKHMNIGGDGIAATSASAEESMRSADVEPGAHTAVKDQIDQAVHEASALLQEMRKYDSATNTKSDDPEAEGCWWQHMLTARDLEINQLKSQQKQLMQLIQALVDPTLRPSARTALSGSSKADQPHDDSKTPLHASVIVAVDWVRGHRAETASADGVGTGSAEDSLLCAFLRAEIQRLKISSDAGMASQHFGLRRVSSTDHSEWQTKLAKADDARQSLQVKLRVQRREAARRERSLRAGLTEANTALQVTRAATERLEKELTQATTASAAVGDQQKKQRSRERALRLSAEELRATINAMKRKQIKARDLHAVERKRLKARVLRMQQTLATERAQLKRATAKRDANQTALESLKQDFQRRVTQVREEVQCKARSAAEAAVSKLLLKHEEDQEDLSVDLEEMEQIARHHEDNARQLQQQVRACNAGECECGKQARRMQAALKQAQSENTTLFEQITVYENVLQEQEEELLEANRENQLNCVGIPRAATPGHVDPVNPTPSTQQQTLCTHDCDTGNPAVRCSSHRAQETQSRDSNTSFSGAPRRQRTQREGTRIRGGGRKRTVSTSLGEEAREERFKGS